MFYNTGDICGTKEYELAQHYVRVLCGYDLVIGVMSHVHQVDRLRAFFVVKLGQNVCPAHASYKTGTEPCN